MQPLSEVTLIRPWQWGVAVLSAPGAEVPGPLGGLPVIEGNGAIAISVHHAQDIELEQYGDDDIPKWATATLHLRHLLAMEPPTRTVIYEGVLALSDGRLTVGDADREICRAGLANRTRIRLEADEVVATGLTTAWGQLAANDYHPLQDHPHDCAER